MSSLQSFLEIADRCQGYFLDRFSLQRIDDVDALEVGLRWGPEKPDLTLAFREVYFCSVERPPGPGAAPLDQVTAILVEPSDSPWPEGLSLEMVRVSSLPTLVWFRAVGPVQISVLAAVVSASNEIL